MEEMLAIFNLVSNTLCRSLPGSGDLPGLWEIDASAESDLTSAPLRPRTGRPTQREVTRQTSAQNEQRRTIRWARGCWHHPDAIPAARQCLQLRNLPDGHLPSRPAVFTLSAPILPIPSHTRGARLRRLGTSRRTFRHQQTRIHLGRFVARQTESAGRRKTGAPSAPVGQEDWHDVDQEDRCSWTRRKEEVIYPEPSSLL